MSIITLLSTSKTNKKIQLTSLNAGLTHPTETTYAARHDLGVILIVNIFQIMLGTLGGGSEAIALCGSQIKEPWYGVAGVALSWLQSYLTGRHQRVKFEDCFLAPHNISCGVP